MSGICSRQIVPAGRPMRKRKEPGIPDYVETKEWTMTARRAEVLEFIKSYARIHGYGPSNEEIRKHTGLRSSSTVCVHLKALRHLGKINYFDGKPRSISILTDVDPLEQLASMLRAHYSADATPGYLSEALEEFGIRVVPL